MTKNYDFDLKNKRYFNFILHLLEQWFPTFFQETQEFIFCCGPKKNDAGTFRLDMFTKIFFLYSVKYYMFRNPKNVRGGPIEGIWRTINWKH